MSVDRNWTTPASDDDGGTLGIEDKTPPPLPCEVDLRFSGIH